MLSRQHIAVITSSFPNGEPGSEAAGSFVADFAEVLAEHVNVTVVAPSQTRKADEHLGNLTIRRFAVPQLPLSLLSPYNPFHLFGIIKTLHTGNNAIQQLVREKKVDHVVALWALPSGYWAKNVCRRYGIPYSIWALGSDIWSMSRVPVAKGLLARVLRDSHACFADGYKLKQDVEGISGRSCEFLASSRILPVVQKKRLSSVPPYKLAFLGRWHPNKGVDLMLESLGLLSDEDWEKIGEVRICGGGPLERTIRSAVDTLGKAGRPVTVGSYLSKTEAAELLTWADYLLLPSRIESIPVVFSDAMQAGCPVVAMPVGDIPMLMEKNKVGVLAAEISAEAFAGAIKSALAVPPDRFNSGLDEACKMFDIHRTASRLLDLIR